MTTMLLCVLAATFVIAGGCTSNNPTGPAPAPVARVTVTLALTSLTSGQTTQATAVTADSLGAPLTGRTVTWSSSNATVATVSTSGLATAVAPGTANITATSEGKSGFSVLTVVPPGPQLGALTISDANGVPLNLTNLGGTISLSAQLNVPTTTTGTLVVLIDTTQFATQPVTASSVVPGSSTGAAHLVTPVTVNVNTAGVSYTLTNQTIQALPLAPNGSHLLKIEFIPNGSTQPATTQQVTIILMNPDLYAGRITRAGSLTTLSGIPWSSGDLTLELVPIQFSSGVPQSLTTTFTDFLSDYHLATLTGLAPVGTKTGSNIPLPTILSRSSFQFESKAALGWNLLATDYTYGSLHYTPQTAEPNNSGNCIYTRGTGLVQPSTIIPPTMMPSGCSRWVMVNPIPSTFFSTSQIDASTRFFHDTKGPTFAPGAFTLGARPTITGQSAYGTFGAFGVANNYIAYNYNFGWGLDLTKFTDLGSGVDVTRSFDLYSGLTPNFTPGPGNLLTDLTTLPESGATRVRFFGAAMYDRLGNGSYVPLTTSAANPYTTGNALSTAFGVDPALVGINNNGGTATYSGITDKYAWRLSDLTGVSLNYTVSGSPVGYGLGWGYLRAYKDLDPTKTVYGEGTGTVTPWVAGGTAGATGAFTFPYSMLVNSAKTRYGGTGEGVYTIYAGVNDFGGAITTGGTFPWTTVYDFTAPLAPTVTSTSTFVPGSTATFNIAGTDNVGVGNYGAGWRFNLLNSKFETGFAYFTFGHNVGKLSSATLFPTFSASDVQVVPNGFAFYDPTGGTLFPTIYNVNAFVVRDEDLAGNFSPLAVFPINNNFTSSLPANLTAVRYTLSTTTACAGTSCSNGAPNSTTVIASWDGPTIVNPLSKFALFEITVSGRVVELMEMPAATSSAIPGGFRFSASAQIDWTKGCQAAGLLNIFGLAETADQSLFLKPNIFYPMTVTSPTTTNPNCLLAPGH